jgi:hypothetical protein
MYIVARKTLTMLYLHFYTSARVTMEMTTNVFPLSSHIAPFLRLLVPSSLQVRRQSVEEDHRHRERVYFSEMSVFSLQVHVTTDMINTEIFIAAKT